MEGPGVPEAFAPDGLQAVSTEQGLEGGVSVRSLLNSGSGNGPREEVAGSRGSSTSADEPGREVHCRMVPVGTPDAPGSRVVREGPRGPRHPIASPRRIGWERACPTHRSELRPTQPEVRSRARPGRRSRRPEPASACPAQVATAGAWSDPASMSLLGGSPPSSPPASVSTGLPMVAPIGTSSGRSRKAGRPAVRAARSTVWLARSSGGTRGAIAGVARPLGRASFGRVGRAQTPTSGTVWTAPPGHLRVGCGEPGTFRSRGTHQGGRPRSASRRGREDPCLGVG